MFSGEERWQGNLSDYDSLEAGRFYPENEIIITNELKFYNYELNFIPQMETERISFKY